jgi:integrase
MASIERTTTSTGDRRYRVRFRDPDGRSHENWFRTKAEANRYGRNVEVAKDRGEYIDPRAGRVPFKELAERWMETRADKARSTRDRDRSYLRSNILPHFGKRRVGTIRPSEVEAWLVNLDRAPATRSKSLQIVRSILDLAVRDRIVGSNPAADVRPPPSKPQRPPKVLTDHEIEAVLTAAEQVDPRCAVVVHLMSRCGLRAGEALGLRVRDVDLTNMRIAVRVSMSRREGLRPVKGRDREDEGRVVPLPADVAARLQRHISTRPVANLKGFLVTAARGGPLRYDNWRSRVWRRIVQHTGLDITPHDLRRTAATRLFTTDRWTPAEVQAFLGHRDARTTLDIYTRVDADSLPQPSSMQAAGR